MTGRAVADTEARNGRMARMVVNFMVAAEIRRMYERLPTVGSGTFI
jgi:hypothetical protein